jgi:hypothetical protein
MKRVTLLLAAGLLVLGASTGRAADAAPIRGTLNLAQLTPVTAESCCAAPCCAAPSFPWLTRCHDKLGRCCEWLMYKPPASCHDCCCVVSSCNQPVYVFFLDMCQGCGHGGCGNGCATAACASGGCEPLGYPNVESFPPR